MNFLFADAAAWFSVPAILGSAYFVINLVLGELAGEFDISGDLDLDAGLGEGGSPAAEFSMLSLQAISAFLMGSGWIGLAVYRFMQFDFFLSAMIAVLGGFGVAWILVKLIRGLMKLQSSGNVPIAAANGREGRVYIAVPPVGTGRGRVNVVIEGRRREFDAVQEGDTPIASQTPVRVVSVDAAGNVLRVEPA